MKLPEAGQNDKPQLLRKSSAKPSKRCIFLAGVKDTAVSQLPRFTDELGLVPALAAARQICRRHSGGWYFASYFLPARKRNGVYAVGAFCQMIREALDLEEPSLRGATAMRAHPAVVSPRSLPVIGSDDPSHCQIDALERRIDMLRDRLDEIYDDRLELPGVEARSPQQHALLAFSHAVQQFDIPRQYLLDLAEGCRMDQTIRRYESLNDLERYLRHSGGAMGLLLSCVLGLTHSGAFEQAIALGNAMQLTTILRDVRHDLQKDCVYLPLEDLRRFGYAESELRRGVMNDNFRALMRFEIDRARHLYRTGAEGLCWLTGDGSRLAASALAVTRAGILDAIERQEYDVFTKRIRLTTGQKFRRLPAAWRLARREHDRPLPDVF